MPALDGLRGVAILLVVFHHLDVISTGSGIQGIFYGLRMFGVHGVDLFFVLSGFLITGILLDSRGKAGYFRNFYARRTLRIFPLYYFSLFLACIVYPATSGSLLWYVFYLSNFLIGKTGDWQNPIFAVTWSLAIEEQFYLVWAPIVFFLDRRKIAFLALAMVVGSLLVRLAMFHNQASWIQIYVGTASRLDAIGIGAFLAAALRGPQPTWQTLGRVSRWVAVLGTALILTLYGSGAWSFDRAPGTVYVFTPVAFVSAAWLRLALQAEESVTSQPSMIGTVLSHPWLRFFGKYSYSIYLLHVLVRNEVWNAIFGTSVPPVLGWGPVAQVLLSAAAIVPLIPLALLSWKLIERPFLSLKRFFPQ